MHIAAAEAIENYLVDRRQAAAQHARRQGQGVHGHRQDRPHAPAGCDAADARPGDFRLGGAARPRAQGRSAPRCRSSTSWRWAAPPSAPASTRIPRTTAATVADGDRGADRPAVRHRAQQVRGAGRARCVRRSSRRAEAARGGADEDRQRRALAGLRPALGPRRAHHSRERAGLVDHAGQGQPDAVRGHDHGRGAGDGQRRRDRHRRRARATSSSTCSSR